MAIMICICNPGRANDGWKWGNHRSCCFALMAPAFVLQVKLLLQVMRADILIVHVEPNAQSWTDWAVEKLIPLCIRTAGWENGTAGPPCCPWPIFIWTENSQVYCNLREEIGKYCHMEVVCIYEDSFACAKHNYRPAEAHVKTGEQVQLMHHSKHHLCSQ